MRRKTTKRKPAAPRGDLATRAEAARALGITRRELDRAMERGAPALVEGPRGSQRYRVAALREWLAGRPKENATPAPTVAEARRRLLETQNELAAIKVAIQRGELIDAKAEAKADFESARTVRDNVLNVPDRIAATIASETDAARVHEILTDALTECLDEIADILDHAPAQEPAVTR